MENEYYLNNNNIFNVLNRSSSKSYSKGTALRSDNLGFTIWNYKKIQVIWADLKMVSIAATFLLNINPKSVRDRVLLKLCFLWWE